MDWKQIESKWTNFTASFRERFSQLTDSEIEALHGKHNELAARVRDAYRYSQEEAEFHLENWRNSIPDDVEGTPTSTSGAPTY